MNIKLALFEYIMNIRTIVLNSIVIQGLMSATILPWIQRAITLQIEVKMVSCYNTNFCHFKICVIKMQEDVLIQLTRFVKLKGSSP